MKFLIVSDREEPYLYDYFDQSKVKGVDCILSCGDLHSRYLEFLTTMVNKPLFYVHGNHDRLPDPEGCDCIEDTIIDFHGIRIAGLGGSMKYSNSPNMYYEHEMAKRVKKLKKKIDKYNGLDIFLTHSPALGYGDLEDLPHLGFDCFNDLLNMYHPRYMFHGHVHKEYGNFHKMIQHPSSATIINACGYVIIDIDPVPYERKKSFFLR